MSKYDRYLKIVYKKTSMGLTEILSEEVKFMPCPQEHTEKFNSILEKWQKGLEPKQWIRLHKIKVNKGFYLVEAAE
jgi:hypothetical protein